MRRFGWTLRFLSACLLFATLFVVAAGAAQQDTPMPAGEILYHQSFSDLLHYENSGYATGTSTGDGAEISVKDGSFLIRSMDGARAYVLMPAVERGSSYTVEFTFRFTESGVENGSMSFLLTCRGAEPTNITSVVIRSGGTVDDFPDPDPAVSEAIRKGRVVTVEIPIEDGAFHRMKLKSADASCTLERTDVIVITPDSMGFAVRNDGVAVTDVYVVNGVDYEKKTGRDTSAVVERESPGRDSSPPGDQGKSGETSPRTDDRGRTGKIQQVAAFTGGAAVLTGCGFSHKRRRRHP